MQMVDCGLEQVLFEISELIVAQVQVKEPCCLGKGFDMHFSEVVVLQTEMGKSRKTGKCLGPNGRQTIKARRPAQGRCSTGSVARSHQNMVPVALHLTYKWVNATSGSKTPSGNRVSPLFCSLLSIPRGPEQACFMSSRTKSDRLPTQKCGNRLTGCADESGQQRHPPGRPVADCFANPCHTHVEQ
jgi:hypothetical protein